MRQALSRLIWMAMGAFMLALVAVTARDVAGGSLDPPGAPGSTMQSLDNIPGSWSRWLPASDGGGDGCGSSRFACVILTAHCNPLCVFTNDGVLDHNTGLVWTRDASVAGSAVWADAYRACLDLKVGGLSGWRLPTIAEMMSLADPVVSSPTVSLSPGNPFLNTGASGTHIAFWSSTADVANPGNSWAATIGHISPGTGPLADSISNATVANVWCVRGAVTQ